MGLQKKNADFISQDLMSDPKISRSGLESQDLGEMPRSGHAGLHCNLADSFLADIFFAGHF